MAISFSLLGRCYTRNHKQISTNHPTLNYRKLLFSEICRVIPLPLIMRNRTDKKPYLKACLASPQGDFLSRRNVIISALTIYYTTLIGTNPIKAEEDTQIKDGENNEEGGGVIGAIKSIFDPNEKTKSGKVLPKAYLKAAREVVKTLRESLEEDTNDITKFRRSADAAKESIREYLGGWRGQSTIAAEESYVALERAIRSLAEFYSKAGPSALLSNEVKSRILDDLKTAEEYL